MSEPKTSSDSGCSHLESYAFSGPDRKFAKHISELYISGVPFYTKKAIRELADQLSALKLTGSATITLPRVDGKNHEVGTLRGIETLECWQENSLRGMTWTWTAPYGGQGDWDEKYGPENSKNVYLVNPHIRYHEVEEMVLFGSYLPLTISYNAATRDPTTGDYVQDDAFERIPYDELLIKFQAERNRWESSTGREKFRDIVTSTGVPPIRKVVAFACGPMSYSDRFPQRGALQHALILTLRDIIGQHVECFAQDPAYADADKKVLQHEGIQVVDDPRGFLEVDEHSAMISVAPNVPVQSIICEIAKPSLMIMFDWKEPENLAWPPKKIQSTDPVTPRVRDFLMKEYVKVPFPHTEDGYQGDTLAIYIRRADVVAEV